ncbi:bacteriohemerythrin [Pelotalea chapellei]|uniref:Hemerythrin family protein n=1 Tax=Pelotalea chapellei TaxID=44671 RepID=A0ABS5U6L6_9BACT|nr:hemerythrin family protein [Pelotalea chapellei]MBT1071309.1 hemerythrin family protein [Pelotalea chapellei]
MTSFTLEASYHLNLATIDRQHQQILDRMAAIDQVITGAESAEDMNSVVNVLEIYCKRHFFDEERLMERRSFPTTLEHKIQHDLFVQHLDQLKSSDTSPRSSEKVILLRDWFLNHILSEDMRYAEFFLKKG